MEIPAHLRIPQQDIEIQNFLKAGSSGAVFKAHCKGIGIVAVKMVRTQGRETFMDICKELPVMASLDYRHVCPVYGGCQVAGNELWIVMELVDGGNLKEYMIHHGPLNWDQKLSFSIQAAKAVNYLHYAPTPHLHRDIKSHNFLVKEGTTLMLSGFGMSKSLHNIVTRTNTFGTVRWAAPEILSVDKDWTEKADIYSLGMVFYEIFAGKIPFHNENNVSVVMKKIKKGERPKIPVECPKKFSKIIKKCWEADPLKRPTSEELVISLGELDKMPLKKEKHSLWSRISGIVH